MTAPICVHGCPFLCCDKCVAAGKCVQIGKGVLEFEFKCPFCGLTAAVVDNPMAGVWHTLPICKMFEALAPEEYMATVRRHLERLN